MNEYLEGRTLTEAGRHAGPVHADEPKLLHEQYDNLFKAIVTAGWCVKSDGDVESDPGYFSLTEIPRKLGERAEMWDALLDEDAENVDLCSRVSFGWYITIENSQGFIFVYKMKNKKHAENVYDELEKAYLDWRYGPDDSDLESDPSNHPV